MPGVSINQFRGSNPRLSAHLVSAPDASVAIDCRFWHGDVSSWREPKLSDELAYEEGYKYELMGCCWVQLPICASVARGGVSCTDKFYVTGRTDYPEIAMVDLDTCEITWRRLGLPCPYKAPSVYATETQELTKDVESRTYVYQFENAYGERSAASAASTPLLLMNDGIPVVVSGWEVPDASWGVTTVRIYRSVAGMETGKEGANSMSTTFMYVGSADIGAASFTDNKINDSLTEALSEDVVLAPPEGLQGITEVDSQNTLVGYVGNQLFFSKNNSYENWPYSMTLDDNVCGIIENAGILYVATDGHPYVLTATAECKTADCRQIMRHSNPLPMIGCGSRRMAALPSGVVYPSVDGLVLLSGNNAPVYITTSLYAPDDWQKLLPESVIPVYHLGFLYVFSKRQSFALAVSGSPSGEWKNDYHTWLSDTDIYYAFVSRNGNFYVEKTDAIYLWDKGTKKRKHKWVSGDMVSGVPTNFGAVKMFMEQGSETVEIYSDNRLIFSRESNKPNQPMTLPMWGTGQRFRIELSGTSSVKLVTMATSIKELTA